MKSVTVLLILLAIMGATGQALAQEPQVRAFPMAPGISEPAPARTSRGTFYRNTITVRYGGERVILSSNSQGNGMLRTDDLVAVAITQPDGFSQSFTHDFRILNPCCIGESRPVDITHLFRPGENTVTIELKDLVPPVYSSRPYYLVLFAPIKPTPTQTPRPVPTSMPTWTPTPQPSSTATRMPTPIPTVTATATPALGTAAEQGQLPPGIFALSLVPLLAGMIFWWSRRRPDPPGTVDVYEGDRWVESVVLADFGKRVTIGRNGDISVDTPSPELAHIIGQRSDRGAQAVIRVVDLEHPIEVQGEVLANVRSLEHGDEIRVGQHRLRYSFFDESLSEWSELDL